MFAVRCLPKIQKTGFHIQSVRKLATAHIEIVRENLEGADTGITTLGFNRPKQKNALGANFVVELQNALRRIHHEQQSRVLVLRSLVPGVFCAGADLKERLAMPQEEVGPFVANLRTLMDQIQNLPIPVIAALDGGAFGGGLEMSLACDIRVAARNAKLGLVEGTLAIIPGAGGTQRLPRLIGPALAKELIFTGRRIDGAVAHQLGIVNHVVAQNDESDAAFQKSLEIAREILPNGPIAMRMAKKAINRGLDVDIGTGMAIEEACYVQVTASKDRIEGLKAFVEKRKPKYIGQ